MIAQQTLAPQQRPHGNIPKRALSLPANGTSKRLRIAEFTLRFSLRVCGGQRFSARTASERHSRVAGDLLVDGRESRVAESAQLGGLDEEAVANEFFVVGGEDAFDLEWLEDAFA